GGGGQGWNDEVWEGLRGRSADLPEPLAARNRRNLDRDEELVRFQNAPPISRVEGQERNAARARGTRKHERRRDDRENGKSVSGGRGVGDVASESSAILDLNAADLSSGRCENRKAAADQRRTNELCVGGKSSDRKNLPSHRDTAERVEVPEIEVASFPGRSEVQIDVDIRATRQRSQRTLVPKHCESFSERPRLE